jgi:hypothetical protein
MKGSEIQKIAYRKPFEAFRLILADGEEITVTEPRKALISGNQIALVGQSERPNKSGRRGLRIVPLDRILSATTLMRG